MIPIIHVVRQEREEDTLPTVGELSPGDGYNADGYRLYGRYQTKGPIIGETQGETRMEKSRAEMKLVSVNTGLPREVMWHGRSVTTGIFKEPVTGRVALRKLNLDGDRQADLTVHWGEYKAVYCYPLAHYSYWQRELPGRGVPIAIFGENFTVDASTIGGATTHGLLEDTVHLGDQFSIGSAEVIVTQPRLPCYKLGLRFQADDMVKRFLVSGRTGFYLAVTREGEVGADDEVKMIGRDPNGVPVSEITRLYIAKRYADDDVTWVRRALQVAALPESWKEYFRDRVQRVGVAAE
jgi:MOSC domain-containing protein YiiM